MLDQFETTVPSVNSEIIQNRYQQSIAVLKNDHISAAILSKGVYDPIGIVIIKNILSQIPQAVVFDIGANVGNHALVMALFSQSVHLFEPQAAIVSLLKTTQSLNSLKEWHIHPYGLSDHDQRLPIFINHAGNNGATSLIDGQSNENLPGEEVRVCHGDTVVDQLSLNRLDLIKIDVEGFESKVLQGLRQTIQLYRPIVLLEWNHPQTKKEFLDLNLKAQLLPQYTLHAVIHSHHRSRWRPGLINKVRRLIYKAWHSRCWVLDRFDPEEDYQHVIAIPNDKQYLFNWAKAGFTKES